MSSQTYTALGAFMSAVITKLKGDRHEYNALTLYNTIQTIVSCLKDMT